MISLIGVNTNACWGSTMSMIQVTLDDGTVNEYVSGITAGEVVIDANGKKHGCVAAIVNGEQKDFSTQLTESCEV